MAATLTRAVVGFVVLATVGFAWYAGGRERWRALTQDRFVYGIPWATLATALLIVSFYLLAQRGLTHWHDPLTVPYRSWSWFYPLGQVTSGLAHGSPDHLLGNVTGLVVFGSVVEHTIGHYPPADSERTSEESPWLSRPGGRIALLTVGMIALAVVPSPFGAGWSLGYSGAVYALVGIALVTRPLAGVVAVVAHSALGPFLDAFAQPIVSASRTAGPPSLPAWASIGWPTHLMGFLLGTLLGIWLLRRRDRRPEPIPVFGALLLFGLAKSLWLLSLSGDGGEHILYRGAGVAVVFVLVTVITVEATDVALPRPGWIPAGTSLPISMPDFSGASVGPSLVLGIVGGAVGSTLALQYLETKTLVVLLVGVLVGAVLLDRVDLGLQPRIAGVLPDRLTAVSLPSPALGFGGWALVSVVALLAALSLASGPVTVSAAHVTDTGEVTAGDYTVTYAENVTEGRQLTLFGSGGDTFDDSTSGLLVVSERRAIWSEVVSPEELAHEGTTDVHVGSIGWEETVRVERRGWDVTGNDSAFVVDLTVEGETTRSFTTDPIRADLRIEGHRIAVVPTEDGFVIRATRDRSTVGRAPVPGCNESASLGSLDVLRKDSKEGTKLVVASNGTRVTVAEKETY